MPLTSVLLGDGRQVKLGRIRPASRPSALRLGSYLRLAADVSPPASVDYFTKAMAAIRQMYGNDQWGDCVIASLFHKFGIWSGNNSGTPIVGTTNEAVSAYHTICGPGDNGCIITSVLDYARTNGVTIGGKNYKIDGYVAVDFSNKLQVQVALLLFGALKIGVNLPNAWANTSDGGIWDVTSTRIVGGHDIPAVGYNETGVVISTWGGLRTITWAAFTSNRWVDECYVVLAPQWYLQGNLSPSGLDVASLKADLAKIGGGGIPPIDPTPIPAPPTPTPTPTPTPVVTGLTLDQTVAAIKKGVSDGRPYGMTNIPTKVQAAAIKGIQDAWPAPFRSPSLGGPIEDTEDFTG